SRNGTSTASSPIPGPSPSSSGVSGGKGGDSLFAVQVRQAAEWLQRSARNDGAGAGHVYRRLGHPEKPRPIAYLSRIAAQAHQRADGLVGLFGGIWNANQEATENSIVGATFE